MHTPNTLSARRALLCLTCIILIAVAGCGAFPGRQYHPAHPKPRGSQAPGAATAVQSTAATAAPAPATKTTAATPAPGAATQAQPAAPAEKPLPRPGVALDRVVAVVNDQVILKSE